MKLKCPRVMIAGVHSSVGKTTISLGIMKALSRQGMNVQPFKVGPDYIDPGLHYHATGNRSHNLDGWMSSPPVVATVFARNADRADISVIEGVMGFYDGGRERGIKGSSAEMSINLKVPVILVVDASAAAQSCIAVAKGFIDYCPDVQIRGVILNRATEYHKIWISPVLEEELGVKVIGCLPYNDQVSMPERHLGLLPADENRELRERIDSMADHVTQYLDLDAVRQIADNAPEIDLEYQVEEAGPMVTIGVARDRAFSFYYQDSLDLLQELGAELVYFSPLDDGSIPRVDGLYIGGGFPEMFLDELSANQGMIEHIQAAFNGRVPIWAECGGFMYLCREICDWEGKSWAGAGIVPARVRMTRKLQALGYVEATALGDSIIARQGDVLRGHEFHFSIEENLDPSCYAFAVQGGIRSAPGHDGYNRDNVLASYVHLHLRSNKTAAVNFLQACRKYHDWWFKVNRCQVED
ncbi:MAG: cobyrinate a,c-diamide synthase [Syntrophomonadaceae bacterium]